jgi:hypothetical protein
METTMTRTQHLVASVAAAYGWTLTAASIPGVREEYRRGRVYVRAEFSSRGAFTHGACAARNLGTAEQTAAFMRGGVRAAKAQMRAEEEGRRCRARVACSGAQCPA